MTRRIALIAGGAALVLLVAWFFLLWSPKGNELDKARKRTVAAEQQASELQVQLDRLKDAQRHEPELQAAKARLVSAIPERADLAAFILDANDAASKSGVDFMSINPTPPELSAGGPAPEIRFAMKVTGRYSATLDFLQRMNQLPRIVVFDQVQVTPESDAIAADLSANLSGRLFTLQQPAAAPGATTTTTVAGAAGATTTSTTSTTIKAAG